MNVKKMLAVGVLASTLVLGSGVAAVAATTTNDTAWPAWTNGRPAVDPGVRLWHDANGWHVRVTHASLHDRTFSGVVHTTGELVDVKAVRLEANDTLKVSADKHSIAFRFNNYGGIDGFDWETRARPRFGSASRRTAVCLNRTSSRSATRARTRQPSPSASRAEAETVPTRRYP
jgi:hypothetical protein